MQNVMATPKTRMTILLDDPDVQQALKLEAVRRGIGMSNLGEKILAEALSAPLAEVKASAEADATASKKPRKTPMPKRE